MDHKGGLHLIKVGVETPGFFQLLEYWFPVQLMQKNDSWCFSDCVDLGCPPRLCTGSNIITFGPSQSPTGKLCLIKRWGFRCYTHHFIMIQLRPVCTMWKQTNIDKGGFRMGRWVRMEQGFVKREGGKTDYFLKSPLEGEDLLICLSGRAAGCRPGWSSAFSSVW